METVKTHGLRENHKKLDGFSLWPEDKTWAPNDCDGYQSNNQEVQARKQWHMISLDLSSYQVNWNGHPLWWVWKKTDITRKADGGGCCPTIVVQVHMVVSSLSVSHIVCPCFAHLTAFSMAGSKTAPHERDLRDRRVDPGSPGLGGRISPVVFGVLDLDDKYRRFL